MTCLISGETVTVRSAAQSFDELGEPTGETVTETAVENVVVCPARPPTSTRRAPMA